MKKIGCKEARELVKSSSILDRAKLAGAKLPPECAGEIYTELSEDENWRVRCEVARNQAIPPEYWEKIFKRLERDGDPGVLNILQRNLLYKAYKEGEERK